MNKNKIIEECKNLYFDIDSCIDELIKARMSHDTEAEGKALFRMEGLMVGTLQDLSCIEDYLEKQKDIYGERSKNITANILEDRIEGIQRELIEFLSNTVNASWVDIIQSADAYAERIRNIIEKQKEQQPTERVETNKSLRDVVITELGKYNGENFWKSPWALDSTGLQYPLYFANLGATWQKEQQSTEW